MYNIVIELQEATDIEKICTYYFSLPIDSNKIVHNFLQDIQQSLDTLKINPFFAIKINQYRSIPLKRFPFIIFFELIPEQNTVKILSIFNTNQDTSKYPI